MRPNWFIGLACTAEDLPGEAADPPKDLRLLHPRDRHLTVAFLGGVDEHEARAAFQQLPPPRGPITVSFGDPMGLGHPRKWTALTLGLDRGRAAVSSLMEASREAMWSAAGAARDRRPALPHVTIGRLRVRSKPAARSAALSWAETLERSQARALERWVLYSWSPWRLRKHRVPPRGERLDFRWVDERLL